jgi:flagellar hook-associated protein 3 FlgL
MRVTQASNQTQFIAQVTSLESDISITENQVSSGDAYTEPAQDPAAAGTVDNYDAALAQSQQYTANANSAQTALNTESTTLTQVQSQLQSLRDLALEANSGTESSQDQTAIAAQVQQIQSSLLGLANTQDGNGNYIFAGFATQTQPFTQTATGATYNGDQGQPLIQLAPGQTLATGDNGATVFNAPTGNGTFTTTAAAGNTGSGVIGATTVSGTYTGHSYTIAFTGPSTYTVTDTTTNPPTQVVPSTTDPTDYPGTYSPGGTISVPPPTGSPAGTPAVLQVTLSGQPKTGDSFSVAPSTSQSIFTTIQNLVSALQTYSTSTSTSTQLTNSINTAINNISQSLTQTSDVQASVGGRLNAVTTQLSVNTAQQTQLQTSISALQGVNTVSAITTLESENTTLQAAFQAYTITEGLSLFKYIS